MYWKIGLGLGLGLGAVVGMVVFPLVAQVLGGLVSFGLLMVVVGYGTKWAVNSYLDIMERKVKLDKERKETIVISNNHGTWLHDIATETTKALHLAQTVYTNGHWEAPNELEKQAWLTHRGLRPDELWLASPSEQLALPAPNTGNLLDIMTNTGHFYGVIGGQQLGKTHTCLKIMHHWQEQDVETWFIGPKRNKDEWEGARIFGGRHRWSEVAQGFLELQKEAKRRHDSDVVHQDNVPLAVFIDDWTEIVDTLPDMESFVISATTVYASVNIVLYFLLHLDTAKGWGVAKKGAALKDNGVKLYLTGEYGKDGHVIHSKTKGVVRFPNGQEVEVPLTEQLSEEGEVAKVLRLYDQGFAPTAISRSMGWGHGGNQAKRVQRIIEENAG